MLSTGRSSMMYPFTPTQWQELEHQALIYKYMASGIPIPSDLLLPIRSSYFLNTATTPTLLPHLPQPTLGWSCYQMGYGRKAEDPEPGRCRRTDGKKWRCSKEAYPDSKYCERHMHRGKNRSRKPVEISLNNNNNNSNRAATATATATANSTTSSTPFSLPLSAHESSYYPHQPHYPHPYYTHTTSEQRDYNSNGGGGSAWELRPLGLGEPKQSGALDNYYNEEEEKKNKHCFVLGADFKLGSSNGEEEEEEEDQRPLRRFFDEWPQKSRTDSWMLSSPTPKTQLSISSIPMGLHPSHLINGSCERGL